MSVGPRTRRLLIVALPILAAGLLVLRPGRGAPATRVETGEVARRVAFQSTVAGSGEIVPARYAEIGSGAMGKIVTLPVAEGDRVTSGQLLARIDPVQAESDVSSAQAQLGALKAEARAAADAVRTATSDLAAAEARERDLAQQYARRRQLADEGLIPATELETGRAAAEEATARAAAARAAVDRARQTEDASTRRVAQADAQVRRASDLVAKTAVVSPMDGTVTRLLVREGEMVVVGIQNQPGTTLMTVSDLGTVNAEVRVAEADVLRVAVGQRAQVLLDALPDRRLPGEVVEIGASALPSAGAGAAAREFKVVVRIDEPDPGLRPGLTCDAEIVTADLRDVLTVPLQSVVLRADAQGIERSGVFVVDGETVRFSAVTPGVIGGLDIEVSGIDEGARIVTGPYQVLRELADGAQVEPVAEVD